MNKKYAIFDMDGTIVDSMGYWKELAVEFLNSKGITDIEEELLIKIRPMTMTESSTVFINEFKLPLTVPDVIDEMNRIMSEHYYHDIELKNGIKSYLDVMKSENVHMCVASATPKPLIEACLKRLEVFEYFDFIISCDEVGAGKGSPAVYHACGKQFGNIEPKDIAVFEDAIFAGRTARIADYYLVGVYDEISSDTWNELVEISDEIITDWNEAACKEL